MTPLWGPSYEPEEPEPTEHPPFPVYTEWKLGVLGWVMLGLMGVLAVIGVAAMVAGGIIAVYFDGNGNQPWYLQAWFLIVGGATLAAGPWLALNGEL